MPYLTIKSPEANLSLMYGEENSEHKNIVDARTFALTELDKLGSMDHLQKMQGNPVVKAKSTPAPSDHSALRSVETVDIETVQRVVPSIEDTSAFVAPETPAPLPEAAPLSVPESVTPPVVEVAPAAPVQVPEPVKTVAPPVPAPAPVSPPVAPPAPVVVDPAQVWRDKIIELRDECYSQWGSGHYATVDQHLTAAATNSKAEVPQGIDLALGIEKVPADKLEAMYNAAKTSLGV